MNQQYEDYWKITLAFTDIYTIEFSRVLKIIIDFIDSTKQEKYSDLKYKKLQDLVSETHSGSEITIRKIINTYVKLGFVNTRLKSYHPECMAFINADSNKKKKSIFSKIVYSNSSFDRSIVNESNKKEINFLIKTLEHVKKIDKDDLYGLMTTNIEDFTKGYLDEEELINARAYAEKIKFEERKYNQNSHFWSILSKLDDLAIVKGVLYLEDDAPEVKIKVEVGRDQYLQRIYKNQLKEESRDNEGDPQCMVENLSYPYLIASHIKPYAYSSELESFDSNNGLLLSLTLDSLFDRGYISFSEDGKILLSSELTLAVKEAIREFKINEKFINEKRREYLKFHREVCFRV